MPTPPRDLQQLEARYLQFDDSPKIYSGTQAEASQVVTLLDGQAYFTKVHEAMQACQGTDDAIYLVGWILDSEFPLPPDGETLSSLLVAKKKQGVDVRVLVSVNRWMLGKMVAGPVDSPEDADASTLDQAVDAVMNYGTDLALKELIEGQFRTTVLSARALRIAGGPDPPLNQSVMMDWSGSLSHHAKYVLVRQGTKLTAYLGGMDFWPNRINEPGHPGDGWHDAGIELQGPAAEGVWDDFMNRWSDCATLPTAYLKVDATPEKFNPSALLSQSIPVPPQTPVASSTISVQIVRSYPKFKINRFWSIATNKGPAWQFLPANGLKEIRNGLKNAINQAQKFIYVECQTLNLGNTMHKSLFTNFAQAANRGVKVIFVTSGYAAPQTPGASGSINHTVSPEIQSRIIDQLLPGFSQSFTLYRVDELIVHSKVIIIDDEFLSIGSANTYDWSMSGHESELNAFILDSQDLIRDFRVDLWKDHVRLEANDPNYGNLVPDLQDLDRALSLWRTQWGSGVRFTHPGPVLQQIY